MKNNKGFAELGIIIAIIVALIVGGGVVYLVTRTSIPAAQNTVDNNYQPVVNQNNNTNTPVVNPNTTNTSFSILSPKEGDQWVIGKTYTIALSSGLLSDYHPLLHSFSVVNSKGQIVGMFCPETGGKGTSSFSWIAGNLSGGCSGTGNTEVKMSQGRYQILFTELDSNGNKIRSTKSEWFNLVTSSVTQNITLNQIKNATYEVGDLVTMHGTGQVTLVNGNGGWVQLNSQNVVYGDFNSDGGNDAFVLLDTQKEGGIGENFEMALLLNGAVKTYYCGGDAGISNLSQFYVKNGIVINGDKNIVVSVDNPNLREAYKFIEGKGCVSGDVDILTGKAVF